MEGQVSNDFGFDPEAVLAMQQVVVWVDGGELGAMLRTLTVGVRMDNVAYHGLTGPLGFVDEVVGQVVNQLRMRWSFSSNAEIFWCSDQAMSEEVTPNVIGNDSGW